MNGDRRFPIALFAFGAFVRLVFLIVWIQGNWVNRFPYDPYPSIALGWLGWGPAIPSITHPPLYPALLFVLFLIFRHARDWAVPALQCLLSAASPLLLYRWSQSRANRQTARIAALWMALDPALIFFAPQYQSETLFVFLILCFFVAWDFESFSAGILGAAASLCRGVFLAYAPFLALWLVYARRWKALVLLTIGWSLPIAVWAARNYRHYGVLIPVSAQSGWNMYEGFTLDRQELRDRPFRMGQEVRELGLEDPVQIDRHFQRKIWSWIEDNPAEAGHIALVKAFRFWRPWPYDPYPASVRWLLGLYFAILMASAAVGIWALGARACAEPIYALMLSSTVVHSLYFTSLRYRVPLEPFLCFFASAGLYHIFLRTQSDKRAFASASKSQ